MKTLLLASAICLGALAPRCAAAEADTAPPLASVQKTLKERSFYFGEVTGKADEETRAAVRRFQIHGGLPVTGDLDSATLAALRSGAASEAGEQQSVRSRAQGLELSDQQFLDKIEAQGPPSAPPARKVEVPPQPESRGPRPAPAEPERRNDITAEEAREFVRAYLASAEEPHPDREIGFYADRVQYFDSGEVSLGFIAKDQRNYYRRWSQRDFELIDEPQLISATEDRATVRFRIRYALQGAGGSASGGTENIMQIRRTGDGLKIVGMRERKLSR